MQYHKSTTTTKTDRPEQVASPASLKGNCDFPCSPKKRNQKYGHFLKTHPYFRQNTQQVQYSSTFPKSWIAKHATKPAHFFLTHNDLTKAIQGHYFILSESMSDMIDLDSIMLGESASQRSWKWFDSWARYFIRLIQTDLSLAPWLWLY